MSYKEYQPLRIFPDWKVEWNCFFEDDPNETGENLAGNLLFITSENRKRSLELTWFPEDNPDGEFVLKIINLQEEYSKPNNKIILSGDWENLHLVYTSKNHAEVVAKIEELLFSLSEYKDERVFKKRGIVDKELEDLRLDFLEKEYSEEIAKKLLESKNVTLQNLLIDSDEVSKKNLLFLSENGVKKGIKNKAKQKLNSKKYR